MSVQGKDNEYDGFNDDDDCESSISLYLVQNIVSVKKSRGKT